MIRLKFFVPIAVAGCLAISSCHRGGSNSSAAADASTFKPIDRDAAVLWDRQTTESAELLRALTEEFNQQQRGMPIKVERTGGYTDIFRKVSASIQARTLPAMAVSYESMTAEYVPTGAVVALDKYIHDATTGLTDSDLEDFFPAVIATNTFSEFGGQMYSFPFTKSVLVMYFNRRTLDAAGIAEAPRTWDEFLAQARQIKARTGKAAYAVSPDCSTIDAMIFSEGGEILRGRETLFDSPESVRVFELLETMAKEGLAYQITPGTYDDEVDFSNDKIAFTIRTSSGRAHVGTLMNDPARWGIARLPQADPAKPATVLFGANITIFNTTPEQQQAAWAFIKYFTSAPVNVRWSIGTGYVPIRRSAAEDARMQKFFSEWPYNRVAFDCMSFARAEPNIAGWQQVRDLVQRAEIEVLTQTKSARQAVIDLKRAADAALQR